MFRLFLLSCVLAVAAAAPNPALLYSAALTSPYAAYASPYAYTSPYAYSAYTAPVAAYSAYTAPVATYSAYSYGVSSPYTATYLLK